MKNDMKNKSTATKSEETLAAFTCNTPRWEDIGKERSKAYYDGLLKEEKYDKIVHVYLGRIPEETLVSDVYPTARTEEIAACQNERVRREKYCAWKLLGYALKKSFGTEITDLSFEKLPTGKWRTEGYYFSISHADKLVAVAVDEQPIGVDVEKESERLLRLGDKILTEREKMEYAELPEEKKSAFLLNRWTVKESVFKAFGKSGFSPRETECTEHDWAYGEGTLDGEKYGLAVAMDGNKFANCIFVKGYLDE